MSTHGVAVTSHDVLSAAMMNTMRLMLLRLALVQDERAASEAARAPYWSPCPDSVLARRTAAEVLRECADQLRQNAAS
jgi:hypothetical protein